MNQATSTQASRRKNKQKPSEVDTHVHGRRLLLARAVWAILIILTLSIFAACLPIYYSLLQTTCIGATCADKQLTPATAQTLQHLGISLGLYATANLVLMLIWACTWFVVGAIIAWRKSNDWMALLVAFWLILQGTTNATLTVGDSQSSWHWTALFFNNLAFLFLDLVFFLFPDGRFVPRWMRWVMLTLVVGSVLSFLFPDLAFLMIFSQTGGFIGAIFIIITQIYRYRRVSTAVQRQQTKWVVYALTVTLVCDLIVALPVFLFPSVSSTQFGVFYGLFFETAITFFTFLIPIAFGVAIPRNRLWDIDIIINRTLVYGTLTAILALIYFGLIFALQFLLRGIINLNNDVAIVVSTLAIAALFQPLRHRIQRFIDRRFYRSKYDAAKTLEAFSATLRNEVDLNQLREELVAIVQETMQPSHVSLWLRKSDNERKPNTLL
ncbi:MAG TPA: hypothetical protein VNW73_19105 [Ktedonobacteraceae bacterium]|jgi:hypothetical protein|nr:hypothetical protein [Ktedonobacteraceae bacterium]